MPLVSDDTRYKNQLASEWMHRGMDLANENSAASLEQAVRCFDEAIALRRALPLEENHFYRYGLSAGWINRADALARREGDCFLNEAMKSYDEALVLLESLPLEENILYPRRLAITWINRGMALQKQVCSSSTWESAQCFREAIGVLESPSAATMPDGPILLAGALTNLAGVLIGAGEEDTVTSRSVACRALALVRATERNDIASAGIGLKARHALCRLAVKDIVEKKTASQEATVEWTDAVDEGLALAGHWNFRGEFAKIARDIFRLGCRIHESQQPHFLAEFLMENLAPDRFGKALPLDQETSDAVQAAIWSSLGNLQLDGFRFISTPQFETFLASIEELRKVELRLKEIPLSTADEHCASKR